MSLKDRVALVTGGGRGIGRAISLALAEDGADVAINFRKDEAAAAATADDVRALGRRAEIYQGTVGALDECRSLAEAVLADFGFVDILINNAGIASRGQSVVDTDPDELDRVLRAHAYGPHHLCQALLPAMRERPRGDVVMISSVATDSLAANGAPYNMAKAAMEALAGTLAAEERRHDIHVNVVAPGLVDTVMGEKLMKATAGIDDLRTLDRHMPFGRVCQPEDVADVVRYLVSERAGYLTGERIRVHGGGQL